MADIEIQALLEELSAESPCGESLEYDEDYGQLELAARGKPEHILGDSVVPAEEPDWTDVAKRATSLLSRTKDLRIGVYLTRAALHTDGLAGFGKGLALIRGLIERYWDTVYPRLDPEDRNDPTLRVNTVMALGDENSVLRPLRDWPLVTSRSFGPVSYRDIAVATGALESAGNSEREPLSLEAIHAAFAECGVEAAQAALVNALEARENSDAIEREVTERVGAAEAPNLEPLRKLLGAICRALSENVGLLGGATPAPHVDLEPDRGGESGRAKTSHAVAAQSAPIGQIRNRAEVIETLDKICAYYRQNEPSSPVPLLLRRAKRLVAKDFMEILQDMAPEGVSQAERITGERSSG